VATGHVSRCYLIETPGDFTGEKLKAYNFVICGWVKPLRVLKRNSGYDSHDATSSSSFPHPPIRLRNDLYCVGWGVKLYSLTHSPSSDFCPSPFNDWNSFRNFLVPTHAGRLIHGKRTFRHRLVTIQTKSHSSQLSHSETT